MNVDMHSWRNNQTVSFFASPQENRTESAFEFWYLCNPKEKYFSY